MGLHEKSFLPSYMRNLQFFFNSPKGNKTLKLLCRSLVTHFSLLRFKRNPWWRVSVGVKKKTNEVQVISATSFVFWHGRFPGLINRNRTPNPAETRPQKNPEIRICVAVRKKRKFVLRRTVLIARGNSGRRGCIFVATVVDFCVSRGTQDRYLSFSSMWQLNLQGTKPAKAR